VILQLSDDPANAGGGGAVHLRYTRRELAEMIGVSTETAIRLLAKLKRKAVIALRGREIELLDRERLARIAQHDELYPSDSDAENSASRAQA
jgi:DNA-binding transcriptional regulator LsrR (DeoR family)